MRMAPPTAATAAPENGARADEGDSSRRPRRAGARAAATTRSSRGGGASGRLGIPPERTVSSRASATPGASPLHEHLRHARDPRARAGAGDRTVATRPDLAVWVVSGDGDALSIGGNHLIHALRRDVPMKILLFNNRIYGLTKGQASPTSELGKVTKSTPFGSIDSPFNPISLALGAGATFVARTLDTDKQHLPAMLRAAAAHPGAALIEIYQNCPVFNDGAFDALTDKQTRDQRLVCSSTVGRSASAPSGSAAWCAGRRRPAGRRGRRGRRGRAARPRRPPRGPSLAFALTGSPTSRAAPRRSGIFRHAPREALGVDLAADLLGAQAAQPRGSRRLLHTADTWSVGAWSADADGARHAVAGTSSSRTPTRSDGRRFASMLAPSARPTRFLDLDAAHAAGHSDLVAPPMFTVVLLLARRSSRRSSIRRSGSTSRCSCTVQELDWGPLVIAGDEVTTQIAVAEICERIGDGLLRLRVAFDQPGAARRSAAARWTQIVRPRP